MIVNITRLRFEAKPAYKLHKDEPDRLMLDMELQNDSMEHKICPLLHSQEHIDHIIACLRGKIPIGQHFAIDDGIYVIRATPHGFQVVMYGKRHFFIGPGDHIADYIRSATTYGSEEVPQSVIENWKRIYGPRTRVIFDNFRWGDRETALDRWCRLMQGPYRDELRECLAGEIAVARAQSDGEINTVNVYNDGPGDSFYVIVKDHLGRKIINGGIIFHRHGRNGHGYYSSHH